jgi:Uma2 family endonuclease
VSDTTLQKDVYIKLLLYGEAGIPEVWIVDTHARKIYQHLNPHYRNYLECRAFNNYMKITADQVPFEAEVKKRIG